MRKIMGLLLAAIVMAGCSTTMTTTASFKVEHSPLRVTPQPAEIGMIYGTELRYHIDRGQHRIGGCVTAGHQALAEPHLKKNELHHNSMRGEVCSLIDIGSGPN